MSEEIFYWQPHLLEYEGSESFSTIKTQFENGNEQRRARRSRAIGAWNFTFKMGTMQNQLAKHLKDQIRAFFSARKGSYDNFWLPSWEIECKIISQASSNTLSLNIDALDGDFSDTIGDPGNHIYICSNYAIGLNTGVTHEIKRIQSISGTTLTLADSLTNTYAAGCVVMKASKVVFTEDVLSRSFNNPYAWEAAISFTEDIVGYFDQLELS